MGRSVLDYLACLPTTERPESVTLVSRTPISGIDSDAMTKLQIKFVLADLTQPWNLDRSATHILQLAADGSSSAYSKQAAVDFVQISRGLIEWCKTFEFKPVVCHASSGACFGYFPLVAPKSDSKAWTKGEFVEGRLRAESLLQDSDEQGFIDLRIARLYSFVGRHLSEKTHYAVPSFVSMAQANRQIRITGNPLTTRSYLSAQEMAHWLFKAINLNNKPPILAIGSSIPVTIIEVAEYIADIFSVEVQIENSDSIGDIYVADNSLTKKILGVDETIHWRQSLLEFVQLSRSNGVEREDNE